VIKIASKLSELDLKLKYRSSDDNMINDFYVPVLSNAILYERAVGYFTSSSLIEISKGIKGLVNNGGKIKIIASPKLEPEDIKAINAGYEKKKKIKEALLKSINKPKNYFEKERLNIIAHLIADDFLDIKIATFESKQQFIGLYHEKFGIIKDNFYNKIAFTGSLNESSAAFNYNFESIDVYCSWISDESKKRVEEKEEDFKNLWDNKTNKLSIYDFPEAIKNRILEFKEEDINWNIDEKESNYIHEPSKTYTIPEYYPKTPEEIEFYDYQLEAINNWEKENYKGIFDMATGTGKTYTALGGVVRLYEKQKKLAIVIVCPYQHLVEQWVEDIKKFNMKPIIGYSTSSQRDWKDRLSKAIFDYNLGIKDNFCFVTTNATYSSDYVQKQLDKISLNVLIIGDEAHNLGAKKISQKLKEGFDFRLALSATIVRNRDEEGTDKLLKYFGKRCIEYGLEEAIEGGYLSKYYYYPVIVNLTSHELKEYRRLTTKIAECLISKNGRTQLSESGKFYAIQRARLIAGASHKLDRMKEIIEGKYKNDKHLLIYCGATTVEDYDYSYGEINEEEIRQITAVTDILGNQLDMKVAQFTSKEDSLERERIKDGFSRGDEIQALIAIRCLDEGVNIPNIKTAFILASSTNPKEYIQRRGRVLRLSDNKDYAEIYDFITLPRPIGDLYNFPQEELNKDKSLIKNEINRIEDFSELSSNPHKGLELINKLKDIYNLWGE